MKTRQVPNRFLLRGTLGLGRLLRVRSRPICSCQNLSDGLEDRGDECMTVTRDRTIPDVTRRPRSLVL